MNISNATANKLQKLLKEATSWDTVPEEVINSSLEICLHCATIHAEPGQCCRTSTMNLDQAILVYT